MDCAEGLRWLSAPLWDHRLAIRLDAPPVVFKQTRVAKWPTLTCYKFRSMSESAEAEQGRLLDFNEASGPLFKIKDDPRMTAWTLAAAHQPDELPQI